MVKHNFKIFISKIGERRGRWNTLTYTHRTYTFSYEWCVALLAIKFKHVTLLKSCSYWIYWKPGLISLHCTSFLVASCFHKNVSVLNKIFASSLLHWRWLFKGLTDSLNSTMIFRSCKCRCCRMTWNYMTTLKCFCIARKRNMSLT